MEFKEALVYIDRTQAISMYIGIPWSFGVDCWNSIEFWCRLTEFNEFSATPDQKALDFYPEDLRSKIDGVNEWIYQ